MLVLLIIGIYLGMGLITVLLCVFILDADAEETVGMSVSWFIALPMLMIFGLFSGLEKLVSKLIFRVRKNKAYKEEIEKIMESL
jgi:hypothetical protein